MPISLLNPPMLPMLCCSIWANGWLILAGLIPLSAAGAEVPATKIEPPAPASRPTNPPVRQIAPGLFELDGIRIDRQQRAVSFQAAVNMREGNLEYLIVTTT